VEFYTRAAAHGDMEALTKLGMLAKDGLLGVPVSFSAATDALRTAATAGHIEAQLLFAEALVDAYREAEASRSLLDSSWLEQAWYWYVIAAEAGHAKAQVVVADIYDAPDGQGMTVHDPALAVAWYTRAAEHAICTESCMHAQFNLGTVRVFRQTFTLKVAVGAHACSLNARLRRAGVCQGHSARVCIASYCYHCKLPSKH
jgi:TPR repeat protein